MSKRIHQYQIKVEFSIANNSCAVGVVTSKYLGGKGNTDTFHFFKKSFSIRASRTKAYDGNTIFSNNANSINNQLLKGLLYYYAIARNLPKIKRVSLIRKRSGIVKYNYKLEGTEIIQPITTFVKNPFVFNSDVLKILFEESEKGNAIRNSLSYWLKGISSFERYYKFDHYWRAFNRLFLYQGNTIQDFEGMRQMRKFIINNPQYFQRSIGIIDEYSQSDLRKYRWRSLILNNFSTIKQIGAYKDFIKRHTDERILKLFKELLPYREEFLINKGLIQEVEAHINMAPIRNSIEIVTLLCIKYAYFVRNKMFHGEIPDCTFKIHNDNLDIEMDNLNKLLSTLIFELLNSNILR